MGSARVCCLLSFLQRNVTFCFPASASSLELIRSLGTKSFCRLSISQLDGFSMSRLLLQEVKHTLTVQKHNPTWLERRSGDNRPVIHDRAIAQEAKEERWK